MVTATNLGGESRDIDRITAFCLGWGAIRDQACGGGDRSAQSTLYAYVTNDAPASQRWRERPVIGRRDIDLTDVYAMRLGVARCSS